ncbi:MAG: hypothetical protein UT86_C0006G0005 [Candidatus Magasanikbacteria bacterium GW2011_GWC2_40_17]|uniref:Uncharacterized protein n=1 Tax=Candidatus Magasanikbacteria bacterium GW2011_GWA2_42_32 TaxID=1619039 RepID=A0A0G1A6R9_9BACT|nr:MAG: hypothetical protein UT86_C0006G0005 [Candidatus Magasanikbacteria bacterium GW2011_GWC2_40_17]KKS56629.1 MAG: hypothetical protein UV20_C0008G0005 [Candidatus Magasanikbacteria bacterium GW2011_GWA2_42_32]OGH86105.1 MAG: hypothetical protein A2294_04150 [Candidatus Magasanikbacteria bacterium RIFOXYB2_FULL_38_10]
MDTQHKNLAEGRWFTLSLAEQLGNVGSEVGRAVKWQKQGNEEQKERALFRAFELLDLTIMDPKWLKTPRLKEICRSREMLGAAFYGGEFKSRPEEMEKYFYWYAVEARKSI